MKKIRISLLRFNKLWLLGTSLFVIALLASLATASPAQADFSIRSLLFR